MIFRSTLLCLAMPLNGLLIYLLTHLSYICPSTGLELLLPNKVLAWLWWPISSTLLSLKYSFSHSQKTTFRSFRFSVEVDPVLRQYSPLLIVRHFEELQTICQNGFEMTRAINNPCHKSYSFLFGFLKSVMKMEKWFILEFPSSWCRQSCMHRSYYGSPWFCHFFIPLLNFGLNDSWITWMYLYADDE